MNLPSLSVSPTETTISGMASGAAMAVQMHIIYSDIFVGAGIFAGAPYDCMRGDYANFDACTTKPELIDRPFMWTIIAENFDL